MLIRYAAWEAITVPILDNDPVTAPTHPTLRQVSNSLLAIAAVEAFPLFVFFDLQLRSAHASWPSWAELGFLAGCVICVVAHVAGGLLLRARYVPTAHWSSVGGGSLFAAMLIIAAIRQMYWTASPASGEGSAPAMVGAVFVALAFPLWLARVSWQLHALAKRYRRRAV